MIEYERKKDCWKHEAKITASNVFAVAEWTNPKDIEKQAEKEKREYIKTFEAEFEIEKERRRKFNDFKLEKTKL